MTEHRKPKPHYALPGDVHETALNRIRWVFEEFDDNVTVNVSGGKDSTVVMELAIQVARERGSLPVRAQWLDQECEFAATVDYQRYLLTERPDEIDGEWYQIPFLLFNATNHADEWLKVWDPDPAIEWVREKDPSAITENDYGTDRFGELLVKLGDQAGGAVLTGVRSEESPTRRLGLTSYTSYKWVTWGNKKSPHHKVFHPIYDWTWRDVWKAIADGDDPEHPGTSPWRYNRFYDEQYRHGVPVSKMRVSNYHHETAVHFLFYLQEIEPQTWERATRRLQGISTAGHLGVDDFFVKELPFMFRSWQEYFEYLTDNLVPDPEHREIFRKQNRNLRDWMPDVDPEKIARHSVQSVITNDLYFTKGNAFFIANRTQGRDGTRRRGAPDGQPVA